MPLTGSNGRSQYVTVLAITCGVPQESMLGPLLFLIYVNDLANVSKVLEFYLFADDTSIYFDSDDLITLPKTVNMELRKVKKWVDANRLALNITKTNYVNFHSPSKVIKQFIRIKLGSKPLNRVEYIKYLGILVDSALSWGPRITELSKKLARTTDIFFKIRHYVSLETLKLLYFSLFYSFVSYGITVWGLTHPIDRLCKLHNKVIRAIKFKDSHAHATPLFYDLKFLRLHDIDTLNLLCFVYNCRHQNSIQPFRDFFVPVSASHNHHTRQASRGNIFVQRCNTSHYGKRSAKYAGAILWNKSAPAMREIPSYNSCNHFI